ncbi:MAG: glycosyltransferase family 4 protein [Pirellulales bacterium]|nr:glycosyltransferase family 4 protein [Pirellulales bacterium]
MRVVHLVAGAGGMYCGSCLHANALVASLRAAGLDALLVPVYTPLRTDDRNESVDRVAFGGLNVYLQERFALFRRTPWFFDRLLDHPRLLAWLGRWAGRTQPGALGALTVSMLRGEEGRQRKELDKLVAWLSADLRPDLVHLSNVLLVGMARQLRRRLGVPIVCTLSGEEAFLERLPEPHYSAARAELRARCADLDALVAMNDYQAGFMADYLGAPRSRIHVIPPGLNLAGFETRSDAPRPDDPRGRSARIGYLSRICPEKGLHLLAEAVTVLAGRKDLPPVELHVAGYLDASHAAYLDDVRSQMAAAGLADRFHYVGEPDRPGKIAFLQSLDAMSLPTIHPESKAMAVLEAWAAGVPVVLPDHGVYPEWVRHTGGGLVFEPKNAAALAESLAKLMADPAFARQCGRDAQAAVRARHDARRTAEATIALYRGLRKDFSP